VILSKVVDRLTGQVERGVKGDLRVPFPVVTGAAPAPLAWGVCAEPCFGRHVWDLLISQEPGVRISTRFELRATCRRCGSVAIMCGTWDELRFEHVEPKSVSAGGLSMQQSGDGTYLVYEALGYRAVGEIWATPDDGVRRAWSGVLYASGVAAQSLTPLAVLRSLARQDRAAS
jgi:hypothetical protein